MSATYPSDIAILTNPVAWDKLNQPTTGVPHSVIERRQNEEIVAIETELGLGLKGTKASLAERLSVGLNPDGTLKTSITLESLSDVTYISGLEDKQLLRYDDSIGEWTNWTPNFLDPSDLEGYATEDWVLEQDYQDKLEFDTDYKCYYI